MAIAPYGSWTSPLGTELLTGATLGLSEPTVKDGIGYWLESRPDQGGRTSLWSLAADGGINELTPEHNVRSAVNEYGGGAYDVGGGLVVFTHFPSHEVFVLEPGSEPRSLCAVPGLRFGAFELAAGRRLCVAVREDHRLDGQEPVTTLVALDLDSPNSDGGRIIAAGADFYANPRLRPDGALAWIEYDHPNMPWDTTRLAVGTLDGGPSELVADSPEVSVSYPSWAPNCDLVYLSDASGFWNFYRWDGATSQPLHADPHDFEGPAWVFGRGRYVALDADQLGCTWFEDGRSRLGVLNTATLDLRTLPIDCVSATFAGDASGTLAVLGFAERPTGLYRLDWTTGDTELIRSATAVAVDPGYLAAPEAFTWQSPDGDVHGWYYAPSNRDFSAPDGERPPLMVLSHGGPTSLSTPELKFSLQYWTSRGIAVLDVNYGGSTGYGRAYRQRLQGMWGITDVADCASGVAALVAAGRIDKDRVVIRGGSAGGYTTLQSLVSTDVYAAGISLYGIGDLELLHSDTHKFEAHDLDKLVAPYPAGRQVYLDRSPVHHLDRLSCPMLILQGLSDKVVPPNQAEAMADAVRKKGLPVALVEYEGEGHGFRKAATIAHSTEAMLSFVGQVFGFTPAGNIPVQPIENLTPKDPR
ncbi:MAG: prolyl oligopeptidase family serine peptidase [Propionibacteriaceae bacterium]|nr:S9 family peptidase [Micropruina sp.]